MWRTRIAPVIITCIILSSGMAYAEESKLIDGFRDYAWGTSYEEVSKGLENELGLNGFSTEVFNEEEQTEKNGIKDPTKYSIHIDQCRVAGYDAGAFMNFDEVGLFSGNYHLNITDYETSIRPAYNDLLGKYSTVYGEPLQTGEAEYGYGAIWIDQEKNIVFLDAYDGDGYTSLDINYWSADNPILGWIDRELGEFWEGSCGINLYDVLDADNCEGI